MKLAMNVGALSRKSANASTVVMFALLSITSMVDASGDMLCTCCPQTTPNVLPNLLQTRDVPRG